MHSKRSTRRLVVGRVVLAGLSLLLVVAAAPAAQAATLRSQTTWGGPDAEVTDGTAVAADNSTYLAGFTRSFNPSARPTIFVVKFAADGSLSWQRTWKGPETFSDDEAKDAAVAADGSVYVTGSTVGAGATPCC